jgi:hypothetical protein
LSRRGRLPGERVNAAPDYIEPIVGWRTWLVVCEGEGFRLRSVVYDTLWLPRTELVASCLRRAFSFPWRRRREHLPPVRGCGCGIYAAKDPEDAASYLEGPSWADALITHRVIGTVSLWGRVIECAHGWRASYAYPKTIYVPAVRAPYWLKAGETEAVALALTDYGVPVELLDANSRGPAEIVASLGGGATIPP